MKTEETKVDQSSKQAIQSPRGTHDILPAESDQWQWMESRLQQVVQTAGYREIRVPIFEHTELFKRGVGETTDVVNKEMYTFDDRKQRSITLRPEGTAGVVRAYLEHGFTRQTPPIKLWYRGPMFRYERAQTGRQRQFHQTGIEALGSAGPAIDAETIYLAVACMHALEVRNFKLHVNSIGCNECRPKYRALLKEALREELPHLCADCQDRFERNPLRMLDCKEKTCQQRYGSVPSTLDHLCPECQVHWDGLIAALDELNLQPVKNDRLVRGLDYYTRTVFELITDDSRLGAQSTICAGGRYDYLVETLGGPRTPAVGWAMGMERVRMLMPELASPKPFVYVVSVNTIKALALASKLRHAGLPCELDYPAAGTSARGMGKQLEKANKSGANWAVIQGDDELAAGEVSIKDMKEGTQTRIPVENLIGFLQEKR